MVGTSESAPAVDDASAATAARRGRGFERGDLGGVLEGEADVVEAFEQAGAIGGRNLEAMSGPPGPLMRCATRSTVKGTAPSAATTRAASASASASASSTGSTPFCRQFSR